VESVLPVLYLHGLSTGDFKVALRDLLGEDAAGLSPSAITRLTAAWQGEYETWQERSLADLEFVYVWVDGVHFGIRLEDDPLAALVMVGCGRTAARSWSRWKTAIGRARRPGLHRSAI
jgi:putative transposase